MTTYAFEPSPSNYLALCRNIYENGRETNIRAYCIALDDGVRLATLDMDDLSAGSFGHSFGDRPTVLRPEHKAIFHQPAVGFSVDAFRPLWPGDAELSEARCRRQRGQGACGCTLDARRPGAAVDHDRGRSRRTPDAKPIRDAEAVRFRVYALGRRPSTGCGQRRIQPAGLTAQTLRPECCRLDRTSRTIRSEPITCAAHLPHGRGENSASPYLDARATLLHAALKQQRGGFKWVPGSI